MGIETRDGIGLTCTVDAWDEEEAVGGQAGRAVLEIADSACGVVEPGVRSDPTLGREREGQVIARGHHNGWVDEVRLSERCRGELGQVSDFSENEQ